MGYKPNNNEYIIENDVENINKPSYESQMKRADEIEEKLPNGYEIERPPEEKSIQQELEEAAEAEGLKKKYDDFVTITATRDLLMNKAKKTIPIYIKTSAWILNPDTGEEELKKTKMKFIIKRLTESENTHLLNHKLIGKELADMTEEEYIASSHFRSELLEASVVDPYFTAEEWRTLVDNGTVTALYDEVNKILTSADDSALFQ